MKTRYMLLAAGAVMAMVISQSMAQSTNVEKAREVFNKTKDSVVWVNASVSIEITAGGRSVTRESKVAAMGTVIDPAGLVAVAFSAIDPAVNLAGSSANVNGVMEKVAAKSTHSQIKILLANGTEVDGKIVMTDDVLDLAFVMPEKAGAKLDAPAVSMDKNPKVEILDPLVCMGRMPKAMDQAPAAALAEISSIITKPRHFFTGGRTLGGPVFTLDGQAVGITTAYKSDAGGGNTSISLIIVPAEEVAKSAKQALAKKDEPASKEAPKEGSKDETTPAPIVTPAPDTK